MVRVQGLPGVWVNRPVEARGQGLRQSFWKGESKEKVERREKGKKGRRREEGERERKAREGRIEDGEGRVRGGLEEGLGKGEGEGERG